MHKIYPLLPALLLFLVACGQKDNKKNTETDTKPTVRIESVYDQEVDRIATYTATVEPYRINNISAQMSNRIKDIYVDEGMRVSKGQRLVLLDDINTDTYRMQVSTAESQLHQIEADYNRAQELYRIGGGTKQAVEQMYTQLVAARNTLAVAKRTLRNAGENTLLTSPVNGVVTARNYDPGDMTAQTPILTIGQVQPVKVVINVSETELSKVRSGMPAVITFDTYGNKQFTGTVSLISPTVDVATKTFSVEITMPNTNNEILPGMFARVTLNFGKSRHVVVPDRAIVKQPGSGDYYVYVYADGRVKYIRIEPGRRLNDAYEILSGVENGAKVVVSGQSRLANGMAVELAK